MIKKRQKKFERSSVGLRRPTRFVLFFRYVSIFQNFFFAKIFRTQIITRSPTPEPPSHQPNQVGDYRS